MSDPLRVPADVPGGFIVRLDRTEDGRVMCCLCFGYFWPHQLHRLENGKLEDVCVACADEEEQMATALNAYSEALYERPPDV